MSDVQRLLGQADECCELAKQAQASGDNVTFLAATQLATQLVQLARIQSDIAEITGTAPPNA